MRTCVVTWFCPPCRAEHACVLNAHPHQGPHATRKRRLLDVCTFDGKTALRFPDPDKEEGRTIFQPRKAARR